jgi:Protein of unknown function (DUF2934)
MNGAKSSPSSIGFASAKSLPHCFEHNRFLPAYGTEHVAPQAAYFLAQARGFEPGHELDDWLAAEKRVGAPVNGGSCRPYR